MTNFAVTFGILDQGKPATVGCTKASGHPVFDLNMDFISKNRWVKDGHRTADSEHSTFGILVSRESVRVAFTYYALNGLYVTADGIKNDYLQAP